MNFSSLFAAKHRRVQFETQVNIESLTDVPLVHGLLYCKYRLRNALNEQKGATAAVNVKDHAVHWNSVFTLKITMVLDKDNSLMPCMLHLNVKKDMVGGKKSESIGCVDVDLAEYAQSKFSTRQYLLQQSKMNSTLKITVQMTQIQGDNVVVISDPVQPSLTHVAPTAMAMHPSIQQLLQRDDLMPSSVSSTGGFQMSSLLSSAATAPMIQGLKITENEEERAMAEVELIFSQLEAEFREEWKKV